MVEVEGCRLYLMMTGAKPSEVKLDMEIELSFRKMHEAGGKPSYYWKSTPVSRDTPRPEPSHSQKGGAT
jgi:hypothetical protein